jgi:acid phosphatase type 7
VRSLLAGRSGRIRLLLLAAVAVASVAGVVVVAGVLDDRLPPGTGDTVATSRPMPSQGPTASATMPAASATTPAASARPSVTLLAVGDIAECASDGDERTGALAASLPGTIATLGDTAYRRGTQRELEECFGASWGPVRDRIAWAVSGNHDYMTDDGAPFRAYMGEAAVRDGRTYFSDALGPWHVVVLDTNCDQVEGGCGPDSPQVAWLRGDLAASTARCTVALYHQPRWSSGYHGDSGKVATVWETLADAGVDLVLNGHEHDYERFAPLDGAGAADPAGMTEIVVGTGGGDLRGFRSPPAPGSLVRKSSLFGLLEVTLEDGAWASRFVDTDGNVIDAASGSCD